MARLGDVCTVSSSNVSMLDDKVWLLNLDMVERQTGNVISYNYVGNDELNGSIIQFDTTNVLYSKLRPNLNKVVIPDRGGFATSEMLPLKPNRNVLSREYLAAYLRSDAFVSWAISKTAGAKMPRLGTKVLLDKEIPLPPLEEQRKIAEQLDKVSNLIAKRRAQLDKLDLLVKARFVEMFGDPVSNSKGWKMGKAETHIDLLSGFPFDSTQYTENGINICGGLIIMPQRINWYDCKHWKSVEGYEEYTLQENDIVMALDRPWISEGFKIAMVDKEHLPALLIQRTARIRAVDINQRYLMYCFILGGFDRHCNVTGSLVPHISAKDIRSFLIMLPPVELQNQFSDFVAQTEKIRISIRCSLEKLQMMKKALMQEYFG